jgi:hypothetical protein
VKLHELSAEEDLPIIYDLLRAKLEKGEYINIWIDGRYKGKLTKLLIGKNWEDKDRFFVHYDAVDRGQQIEEYDNFSEKDLSLAKLHKGHGAIDFDIEHIHEAY